MCDNWTNNGQCKYGERCDFFHPGPDDHLPYWPHEAKLAFYMDLDNVPDDTLAALKEEPTEDVDMGPAAPSGSAASSSGAPPASAPVVEAAPVDKPAAGPVARRGRRSRSASNKVSGRRGLVSLSDTGSDKEPATIV